MLSINKAIFLGAVVDDVVNCVTNVVANLSRCAVMKLVVAVYAIFFASSFLASSAQARALQIDLDQSQATFSGEHAGDAFSGQFQSWQVEIDLNPADLGNSHISATFDLTSAKTGNAMYDGTLPEQDWFHVKKYPQAIFKSTLIEKAGPNVLHVKGHLTLKARTQQVAFDFHVPKLETIHLQGAGETANDTRMLAAMFPIDRLAFGIGSGSDPKAEWVSQAIQVHIKLKVK